ncbi:MAG TPA: ABC transporter permease subunit [Dictyobacter sp.]|jgi:ABC-type transport system involved in multi-copper enzyme maturation permease subunit|nr:ABC transporter permease subunit [Dictyobacter sp.]
MSSIPQETPLQPEIRNQSVIMGRQDFVSVLLRAIGGELYKIRRRTMSRVLSCIALVIIIISFAVIALPVFFDATQNNQRMLQQDATPLLFPESISITILLINYIGIILLIILAGTIVGGEYSVGSIRIMLTRGPTRTQYFLAKLGAMLVCVIISVVVLLIVGVLIGMLFALPAHPNMHWNALNGSMVLHTTLVILITIAGLFIYCLLAICLATLGKTTAAGVAGALMWWFLEGIAGPICSLIGSLNQNWFGTFVSAIPDYFIRNTVAQLVNNQQAYLAGAPVRIDSDLRSLLVLLIYVIIFAGVTWWAHQSRDITN